MEDIELKEKSIKQLQKENKYLREKYKNTLNAYFELHSYCNEVSKKGMLKNKKFSE